MNISDTKYTNEYKKKFVKKIENMSKEFQLELYYYLYNTVDSSKYTHNSNGIFININTLDTSILDEIQNRIDFYIDNEKKLSNNEYSVT